jgi:hypothetical protein
MVGGGGGAGGGGTGGANYGGAGSAGTNTVFGSSLLVATSGGGADNSNGPGLAGGAGGTGTIGTGATGIVIAGGRGSPGTFVNYATGGTGGSSPFGGAGVGYPPGSASGGTAGATNSGSGGGGAGAPYASVSFAGHGGGAGGYIEAYISNPAPSYVYTVGAGGGGGAGGTYGAGGGGGSGIIIIEENYPVTGQIPTNASGTTQQFTANGTGSSFTLSSSINTSDAIIAYNGLILPPTVDYTILGRTLSLNFTPANTDLIEVRTMSSSMNTGMIAGTIAINAANTLSTSAYGQLIKCTGTSTDYTVTLPTVIASLGDHTFYAYTSNPNGLSDENSSNNQGTSTFSVTTGATLTLTVQVDYFGAETTWEILDANGNQMDVGGPYANNVQGTVYTESLCLPNGM